MTAFQEYLCNDSTEGFYSQTHTQPCCLHPLGVYTNPPPPVPPFLLTLKQSPNEIASRLTRLGQLPTMFGQPPTRFRYSPTRFGSGPTGFGYCRQCSGIGRSGSGSGSQAPATGCPFQPPQYDMRCEYVMGRANVICDLRIRYGPREYDMRYANRLCAMSNCKVAFSDTIIYVIHHA